MSTSRDRHITKAIDRVGCVTRSDNAIALRSMKFHAIAIHQHELTLQYTLPGTILRLAVKALVDR